MRHLKDWVTNEEERKRLPAAITLDFQKTLSKDDILSQPYPGSRKEDVEGTNRPFDVRRAGEGSYYADSAAALPDGQIHLANLAKVNRALGKVKGEDVSNEEIPAEYRD